MRQIDGAAIQYKCAIASLNHFIYIYIYLFNKTYGSERIICQKRGVECPFSSKTFPNFPLVKWFTYESVKFLVHI